jgi:hypothetical protein
VEDNTPVVDPNNLPPDWLGNPDGTNRIVRATAVLHGEGRGISEIPASKLVELAMQQAIHDCAAEGIGMDRPDEIKARMMDYRQRVLDQIYKFRNEESARLTKGVDPPSKK